jgi:hypothetical protein
MRANDPLRQLQAGTCTTGAGLAQDWSMCASAPVLKSPKGLLKELTQELAHPPSSAELAQAIQTVPLPTKKQKGDRTR